MNVKNKVAIVTGASAGIGLATAKLLSQKGSKVVLASRSIDKLEKLSKNLPNSFAIKTDMTDEKQIKEMVKKTVSHFGRVDILINNAGQGYDAPIEKINIDTFHKVFDLDVAGPLIVMQEVIPIMKKQKQGAIINISSGTALMHLPNMGAYSSLKRALAHMSLTGREELKDDNIAVSVVYPYITQTDFEKNTIKDDIEDWGEEGGGPPKPPDSAEYVAEKILEAIETGKAEVFAHEFMQKRSRE
jgi:short-subunit dehydrogenase